MKKLLYLSIVFIGFIFCRSTKVNAQGVGINPLGNSPDPSAGIDVNFTDKGALIPRMTSAQRNAIASPATGLLIYNTDCNNFNYYNSTAWVDMAGNAVTGPPAAPTTATHTASATQIVWNWNTVSGAAGYKWNTANNYSGATNNGTGTSYTQTGLTCNSAYTLFVWAYGVCGNSTATTLTQTTSSCLNACSNLTTMTDSRDSKVYNIVAIGNQCWLAQNLNYGTYVALVNNGQSGGGTQKYCVNRFGADDPTCGMGGLYEWNEMMNSSVACNGTGAPPNDKCATPAQGICPVGWHVPSHYELTTLEKNVGSNPGDFPYDVTSTGWRGTNEGGNLKQTGTSLWESPNTGATNSSGFTGLPSGFSNSGNCSSAGVRGFHWSSTEDGSQAWGRILDNSVATCNRGRDVKTVGYSVRCIKD